MTQLLLEPFDRRSYLAWVARSRILRAAAPQRRDDVPRRSEAFAEDVEGLTSTATTLVFARRRSDRAAPLSPAANAAQACIAA